MKELLEGFLSRLETETTPKEGEYLGDDGLLYCGKCHTPVQCRKELFGKMRILPCTCRCRQEEMRRQKEADEARERMNTIHRLKATGIQERHLLDWRFDVAEETDTIRWAKHYVENWRKVRDKNLGLLLWGDVGTGKSFAAACIANALLEQAVPVLMTNFSKILNQMGAMYTEERYQYIASFNHYSLLIIDDLGIERSTEYAKEQVYAVVDERYKADLPLIITTNLTIRELRNPATVADARIYSRVLEMCTPVQVSGGDRRQAASRQKQELVKDVLFSGKGGEAGS
ncbi:MAG: ATP-binding protein [Clostridium sp.]|nr:ATP-binding protein [Clostridia bacterium]MBO6269533.1 ATP-binding protein [Clostridium sp.]MBP3927448.1 ATP-binding protein [Clostridium sp.]